MTERERPCGTAWLGMVHGGKLGRGWLAKLGEPPRTPRPQESLRGPPDPPDPSPPSAPIYLPALHRLGRLWLCRAGRQRSRRAQLFLHLPALSSPLFCCGERAKARKALTGSLECLRAKGEPISAAKGSLFQGRVNSLFILAFAARQD